MLNILHDCRGGNISHIVVVKAHTYGYKSTAAARVTYSHKAGSEDTQVKNTSILKVMHPWQAGSKDGLIISSLRSTLRVRRTLRT